MAEPFATESDSLPSPAFPRLRAEVLPVPPSIPDYELLRLIGRGSYGQVAIFHVGRNDALGFFYYVMEIADHARTADSHGGARLLPSQIAVRQKGENLGGSIARSLSSPETPDVVSYLPHTLKYDLKTRGALPVTECLALAQSLATALDHLHSHGLVHRDIKPSNIIFVSGRPKLADIGLVTSVDATRSFVGTDGYIPPEGPGTPQADLYSLGKVLYECVTGKDRADFPELPGEWRAQAQLAARMQLIELINALCGRDLKSRYPASRAFLADLARLKRGKPPRSRRSLARILTVGVLASISIVGIALAELHKETKKHSAQPTAGESLGEIDAQAQKLYKEALFLHRRYNLNSEVASI